MRFYRIHYGDDVNGSRGFGWFTSKREAEREARAQSDDEVPEGNEPDEYWSKVEEVNIIPTKGGILKALKDYAAHPDNG